jgi:hypothetical protein
MCMGSKVNLAPDSRVSSPLRRDGLRQRPFGFCPAGSRLAASCLTMLCALLVPASLLGADGVSDWLHLALPGDAPVGVSDLSLGQSTASVRGLSMVLNLQAQVVLRNVGNKSIHGLTLRVEAQDISPGGRGSVTVPSLNVAPGETFPVRIDLELVRPFPAGRNNGALVQLTLDGVLFGDLSFYGQDRLDSRRALTIYELEARRDREYFAGLIEGGQMKTLREELNFGIVDFRPPQLGLELVRDPKPQARPGEQPVAVSFVSLPAAPVQPLTGDARVFGNEVRQPRVALKNTTNRSVREIELGWILRDDRGRDHMAGCLPSKVDIPPVHTAQFAQEGVLRFSEPGGRPLLIGAVSAFINNVEFTEGRLWIPSRADLAAANVDAVVRRVMSSSPEQQRLADIYRRKGVVGLAAELRKFN